MQVQGIGARTSGMDSKIRPLLQCIRLGLALSVSSLVTAQFDLQGHRGARARFPENSLPAFRHALACGCTTWELDLAVTHDSVLVVSHEPWLRPGLCLGPEGLPIARPEEFLIYAHSAEALATCDCGSLPDPKFPNSTRLPVSKPRLEEVVRIAPDTTRFNLEIKYFPDHIGIWHPDATTFAALVLVAIQEANLADRVTVQSFAPDALEAVHRLAPELATVLLVDQPGTLRNWLRALSFTPFAISPSFSLLTDRHIRAAHRRGMAVVPWTVNDELEFQRLVARGVDGIITDDPCRMLPYVPR